MHVRHRPSRADRALDQARDIGAQTQAKAIDAVAALSEAAQTTLVPAADEAVKRVNEVYNEDVKPALANAAATAGAAAATAAVAARGEADRRTRKARKELAKSTEKAREQARRRGAEAADRARAAVGIEKPEPERHWFRNLVVAMGLSAVAAWAATRFRDRREEAVVIPTTPERPTGTAAGATSPPAAESPTPAEAATAGTSSTDGVGAGDRLDDTAAKHRS